MMRRKFLFVGLAAGFVVLAGTLAVLPIGFGVAHGDQRVDCVVGNPGEPEQSVPELFFGQQRWAYLINPSEECDTDLDGFALENVNMLLELLECQVPVTFSVLAFLDQAVYDPDSGCFVPGEELYQSEPVTFSFEAPGYQVISVPTPDCGCFPIQEQYFIGLQILDSVQAETPIDGEPSRCTVFVDSGNGYVDFYNLRKSSSGNPHIWSDIVFCDAGVSTESGTWTGVKSLYR